MKYTYLLTALMIMILISFQSNPASSVTGTTFVCKKKVVGPTVDGIIGSEEYGYPANQYQITLNDSSANERTATLSLVHNTTHFFIGFQIADNTNAYEHNGKFDFFEILIPYEFDNGTHNLTCSDWKMAGNFQSSGQAPSYIDFHSFPNGSSPDSDENDGGTTDGAAAWTYSSSTYNIELVVPFDSNDVAHDFTTEGEGHSISLWGFGMGYVNDSIFGEPFETYELNAISGWSIEFSSTLVGENTATESGTTESGSEGVNGLLVIPLIVAFMSLFWIRQLRR